MQQNRVLLTYCILIPISTCGWNFRHDSYKNFKKVLLTYYNEQDIRLPLLPQCV